MSSCRGTADTLDDPGRDEERALDMRNPDMAECIDVLHAGGKQVFAAAGSLHMFGQIGLSALMAKRGYLVERVDLNQQ